MGIQGIYATSVKSEYHHSHQFLQGKENLLLQECVECGRSFVVDNTNPTREDRQKYIRTAKDRGFCIHGYYFRSSVSDSIERNRKREGKARIPDRAVACTHHKLELPQYEEGFDKLFYVHIENEKFVVEDWNEEGKDL